MNNGMPINFDGEDLRNMRIEVHLLNVPSVKALCVKIASCPALWVKSHEEAEEQWRHLGH